MLNPDHMGAAAAYHQPSRRWALRVFWMAVLIVGLAAHHARACAFDMIKPARTAIDWIVESDTLILARPKPDNVFAFGVTEVLLGNGTGIDIPFLVNSTTRRRLSANPRDAVLFAKADDGIWRYVAYVNDPFRGVLETSLSHRNLWKTGFHESRLALIDTLQNSADPVLRRLLIGELDKVPYDQLRGLDLRLNAEHLLARLWQLENYPYQAIYALLLGLTGAPAARQEIVDYIAWAHAGGPTGNLGAFSAALIEMDGKAGVEKLAHDFLDDIALPRDIIEQVVMALSVHHALTDADTKEAIATALADLVEKRPRAGALIARQFTFRSDWSQAALLEPLVRDSKLPNVQDLLIVSVYLAQSKQYATQQGQMQNEG